MTKTIKTIIITLCIVAISLLLLIGGMLIIRKINPFHFSVVVSPSETTAETVESTTSSTVDISKEDSKVSIGDIINNGNISFIFGGNTPSTSEKNETTASSTENVFNIFNLKGKSYKLKETKVILTVEDVTEKYIEIKVTNNTEDCDIKVNVITINEYKLTSGDIHCNPSRGDSKTMKIDLNSYEIIDHLKITLNINSACPNHKFNTNEFIVIG